MRGLRAGGAGNCCGLAGPLVPLAKQPRPATRRALHAPRPGRGRAPFGLRPPNPRARGALARGRKANARPQSREPGRPLLGSLPPPAGLAPARPAAWLAALETRRLPNKGRLPVTFARLFKRASPQHKAPAGNGNFMNPNQSKALLTQCEARLKSLIINGAKRKNKMYLWYTENSGY